MRCLPCRSRRSRTRSRPWTPDPLRYPHVRYAPATGVGAFPKACHEKGRSWGTPHLECSWSRQIVVKTNTGVRSTMSDTRRDVIPGWNPTHPRWSFGPMTEKFQHKDRPPMHLKAPGRFCKNGRNSRHNLLAKIDNLRATEALSDVE